MNKLPGMGPFDMAKVIRNVVEMQVKHGRTPFESSQEPCYTRANRDDIHPYLGFHSICFLEFVYQTTMVPDQPRPGPPVWSAR